MVPKLQTKHRLITIFIVLAVIISAQAGAFLSFGVETYSANSHLSISEDTVKKVKTDTLKTALADTLNRNVNDTLLVSKDTTEAEKKTNSFMLSAKIDYASADSLSMDLKNKMAYMYGNASIEYEDISLKAALITIDFQSNIIHAYAAKDSLGDPVGVPEFKQGDLSFKSKEIAYNFNTKKGLIQNVITKEGEGYLHGSVIKKVNDSVTNVGKGEYTTCDLDEHPHFSLKYTKAKVLTGNMIVTGPAYITIEGVPLPIGLPFGLFPNKKGRSSGLIIPKYGESANRGFFLEDGGYYFGLSDYFDLKLTGDIYSRGSWALKPLMTYKKRYKFSGSFSFKYAVTILGTKGSSDYSNQSSFFVDWSHRQDPKARPNSVFSASVHAGSAGFNKYNPATVNDYVSNTFSSSVSYAFKLGTWGNVSTSATESQNTSSKLVNIALPVVDLSINPIYPFRKKVQTGSPAWYESINFSYSMNTKNVLNTYDSLVFKSDTPGRFENGMQHSIPISGSFKVLKYFSWSNSVNYKEVWYTKTVRQTWNGDTVFNNGKLQYGYIDIDTINGFKAARNYSFNTSLGTTIYGMKQWSKGPIRAIRHVIRPSVGFSYVPDFGKEELGYWQTVQTDASGNTKQYSIFGGPGTITPIYGVPPSQKAGLVNFGINNNLEMKVRSLKDTITGTRKVMLIDNFSISTSYDLSRDSLRWSDIFISARTTLFKKIQISYASVYSPYGLYSQPFYGYGMPGVYTNPFYTPVRGPKINKSEYSLNKKLLRFVSAGWNLSVGYNLSPKKKTTTKQPSPGKELTQEMKDIQNNQTLYVDWHNPWSLNFDYNFRYTSVPDLSSNEVNRVIVQTFRVGGDLNITEKWKFSAQTGYDFEDNKFAYTSITIYRDLHCWDMRFSWIPYGTQKSWNFSIQAKASVLQDLKLTKKTDFRDNF